MIMACLFSRAGQAGSKVEFQFLLPGKIKHVLPVLYRLLFSSQDLKKRVGMFTLRFGGPCGVKTSSIENEHHEFIRSSLKLKSSQHPNTKHPPHSMVPNM